MNALIDQFPEAIQIDDRAYSINADYRNCLRIILAFEDVELTNFEKEAVMLNLLYDEIPRDVTKACELAVKFLNCGEHANECTEEGERVYSFEQDAKYIYSAIKQSHGIDLEQVDFLHWWKFNYLFMDLDEKCFFCRLLYLRNQKSKGKLTKEEWDWYYSIKEVVDLPKAICAEEQAKADDFFLKLGKEVDKGEL